MIKLFLKLCFICSFIFAGTSQATLITTDLTDNNYINHNGLDIAWVSPVNTPVFGLNTLYAPDALHVHEGWRFATEDELNIIKSLTLESFFHYEDSNGKYYKHAVEFWNSNFDYIDINDFEDGNIRSNWSSSDYSYETFYVRTTEVPEPSTLMIFSIALIALASRKKLVI